MTHSELLGWCMVSYGLGAVHMLVGVILAAVIGGRSFARRMVNGR